MVLALYVFRTLMSVLLEPWKAGLCSRKSIQKQVRGGCLRSHDHVQTSFAFTRAKTVLSFCSVHHNTSMLHSYRLCVRLQLSVCGFHSVTGCGPDAGSETLWELRL